MAYSAILIFLAPSITQEIASILVFLTGSIFLIGAVIIAALGEMQKIIAAKN